MLTPDTLAFLSELAENNTKDWFQANKKRYETHVKGAALEFIRDFQGPLADLSPHFEAIPKAQGGSLFRIYRDTRFSKDKTPYKTGMAMQFRHATAGKDVHAPGYYLHVEPGGLSGVGAGIWMPPTPVLNRLRTAMVAQPERWATVKAGVDAAGFAFMTNDKDLKRVPRGFEPDPALLDDLRRKSHAVHLSLSDDEVLADDFPDTLVGIYAAAGDFMAFICEALDVAY